VLGVLLGVLLGCSLRSANLSETSIHLVKFPGEMLMRMLKMLIIPIIVTSVITGLASMDLKKSGRMGVHAVTYYMVTTTLAVVLGVVLVTIIQPGKQKTIPTPREGGPSSVSTLDTFLDLIRNLFPENIIAACFQVVSKNSKCIYIFFFSFEYNIYEDDNSYHMSTTSLNFPMSWDKRKVSDTMYITCRYSPIGICSMLAGNLLTLGSIQDLIESLGMYMLTVILGLMIHVLITLPLIYFAITRKNPFRVFVAISQAALTALGTASSAGTLPLSIQCLEQNLGIDERVTKFVLPLGATMNMDGTALLEGVAAITIAQMYQLDLSIGQIFTISVTATFASIGAAAIPSAGLVTLVLVLSAIGLPSEAVGLLWSIDWLLDRIRTCVNVTGDCMGAVIVQHLNRHMLNN
uniref:Amino acid transporter n=1 Tax=Ciona savignyi TaxID=51511 RepID=H2YKT2_CIOSA